MTEDVIRLLREERARTGESLKDAKARLMREGRWPKLPPVTSTAAADDREVTIEAAAMIAVATLRPELVRSDKARVEAAVETLKPVLADLLDRLEED
jgi:hypothetical protein